jgi:hypothetical protein
VPVLRIDHAPIKDKLLGVWQALYSGGVLDFQEMNRRLIQSFARKDMRMKTIKFVVKLNRDGRAAEYVQRLDPTPIHMTTNPKLALLMGRLTAEDAIESLGNSRRSPELLSVPVV